MAAQTPLLTLPQTRFLLMSATLGETTIFERTLTALEPYLMQLRIEMGAANA